MREDSERGKSKRVEISAACRVEWRRERETDGCLWGLVFFVEKSDGFAPFRWFCENVMDVAMGLLGP